MTMDDIVVTTYTNPRGDEHEAIQLPWETVADILGHEHTGNPEDDTTLVRALRDAGAPAWVEDASGWIDEHGWGLIGPATTLVGQAANSCPVRPWRPVSERLEHVRPNRLCSPTP